MSETKTELTPAEMVEKLEPLLSDALDKGRWDDADALEKELIVYRKQLLVGPKCGLCHGKGWVVEIKDHSWSDPEGIQVQVDCPKCTPVPLPEDPTS